MPRLSSFPTLKKFLERTALLRKYIGRYRVLVAAGFATLIFLDLLEVVPPILLMKAVDSIVAGAAYPTVLWMSGIYFGVLFVQGILRWCWRIFLIRSSMFAG